MTTLLPPTWNIDDATVRFKYELLTPPWTGARSCIFNSIEVCDILVTIHDRQTNFLTSDNRAVGR